MNLNLLRAFFQECMCLRRLKINLGELPKIKSRENSPLIHPLSVSRVQRFKQLYQVSRLAIFDKNFGNSVLK